MECFNCGNDADMEVFMMINGKMKKLQICMDCYKEQMQNMMDSVQDEFGNINPDEIQKQMFKFFQNNKSEFENMFRDTLGDENFDMSTLTPDNFDIKDMNFENTGFDLSTQNIDEMLKKLNYKMGEKYKFDQNNIHKSYGPKDRRNNLTHEDKEIQNLENAARRKKAELYNNLNDENYLAAASVRDEMREINKKIMIIKKMARTREGENNEI